VDTRKFFPGPGNTSSKLHRGRGGFPLRLHFPASITRVEFVSSSYQVFARKYRPQTFDDVLGQDHVVQTLRNAIEQDRLAHAYLFVGPRGTGKTSTARILAKALNCTGGPRLDFDPDEDICVEIAEGRSLDVLEIDGASNNGVEQVRDLRETVKYAPTRGRYKIYYIDEVHMLSNQAFNALLKTLEEPPEHVKFIFATTEANKILPTIISRCQRFDLRRIPTKIIADHLAHIATEEGIELEPMAGHTIAKGAEGGMRDAQSMLDQLVAFCGTKIVEADVLEIFGFTAHETVAGLAGAILSRDTVAALNMVYAQSEEGRDLTKLLEDLIGYMRTVLVYHVDAEAAVKELPKEIAAQVEAQAGQAGPDRLLALIDRFAEMEARMKWAPNKRLHFEIGVIKAVQELGETNLSDVISILRGSLDGQPPTPMPKPAPRQAAPAPTPSPSPAAVAVASSAAAPAAEPETPQSAPAPPASPEPAPPEPEPEPAPAPAPQEAPASSPVATTVAGEDLWNGVLEELANTKPIAVEYARKASFLGESDRELEIGLPPNENLSRDALMRDGLRSTIEGILKNASGRSMALKVTIKEGLSVPAPPVAEVEESPEETPESPQAPVEPAPGSTTGSDGDAPEAEEDIHNDPLIKDALRIFEAEIQ